MPYFRLETNIPQSKIPADLPAKLAKAVAETLGKPLNLTVAAVIGDVNISWGGTSGPAGQASLASIGAMGVEENKKHSKVLFDVVEKELGIPSNRLYIIYNNFAKEDVGHAGTTFHDLWPSV